MDRFFAWIRGYARAAFDTKAFVWSVVLFGFIIIAFPLFAFLRLFK